MSSLWGCVTTCSACDFFFQSNHRHDTRGFPPAMRGFFEAICAACLQPYIFATEGPWGPAEGELLELSTCAPEDQTLRQAKKKVPRIWSWEGTGQHILFESVLRDGRKLPDLICIKCSAAKSIVIEFEGGHTCPSCKFGTLHCARSV